MSLPVEVQVALVTGFFSASAVLVPVLMNRRTAKSVSKRMGEPNGHGTLTDMLQEILTRLHIVDKRVDRVEGTVDLLKAFHTLDYGTTKEDVDARSSNPDL